MNANCARNRIGSTSAENVAANTTPADVTPHR